MSGNYQDEPRPEEHLLYDEGFFRDGAEITTSSASAVVGILLKWMPSARVVDIGSGEGVWAAQFLAHGCDVLCLDGDYIKETRLRVPRSSFLPHDLRYPLPTAVFEWRPDLTVCLEVAEHLPVARGPSLVQELCLSSDRLVFSAATPGQGGRGHINERPTRYWIDLIEDQGFAVSRRLQRELHDVAGVAWYYRKNTLVAVRIT